MEQSGFWRALNLDNNQVADYIDQNFQQMFAQNVHSLPDLRRSSTIFVFSDYSGEHSDANYQVLSFLFVDIENCQDWHQRRAELRSKFLSNNRRMSFKQLRDKQRLKALEPFLLAANTIPGLSFTVAIDSAIATLFEGLSPLDLTNPSFSSFKAWTPQTLEKALRIVHFLSVVLTGLCRNGQNVIWVTDEDSIAANVQRLRQLTNLFSWVSSTYLTFDLGHLRCGTTKTDDGSRSIEDFTAIPDLIAGAICEQLQLEQIEEFDASKILWIHRGDFTEKTSFITMWLADTRQPLKRFFFKIDSVSNSKNLKMSWFHFHNQL